MKNDQDTTRQHSVAQHQAGKTGRRDLICELQEDPQEKLPLM